MTTQIRNLNGEVRFTPADEGETGGVLEGYALRFNELSLPLRMGFRMFRERIAPDADIRYESDLLADWSHDSSRPLARLNNGLTVTRDSSGLKVRIELPDTSAGRDAYELARRGIVTGMSFVFRNENYDWIEPRNEDDPFEAILRGFDLISVAPVAQPAYPTTTLGARGLPCVGAACWGKYMRTRAIGECDHEGYERIQESGADFEEPADETRDSAVQAGEEREAEEGFVLALATARAKLKLQELEVR